ncbi:MAG: hypothetical protein H7Y89_17745, partial [Steroidobacteraceae bacterium]|nr:hypothetical protein [Steroidobacteraceae bacterium]
MSVRANAQWTTVFAALVLTACKTPPVPLEPVVVKVAPVVQINKLDPLFEDIEKRTFNFFWDTAEPDTGLVPDRWPRPPFASIASIGFALNAYAIGAERGWVTVAAADFTWGGSSITLGAEPGAATDL